MKSSFLFLKTDCFEDELMQQQFSDVWSFHCAFTQTELYEISGCSTHLDTFVKVDRLIENIH